MYLKHYAQLSKMRFIIGLECDVFDCESHILKQTSDEKHMHIQFKNCKINTLITKFPHVEYVHILSCTIKKIKCEKNIKFDIVYSTVCDIDYCLLDMYESEIKVARIYNSLFYYMKNSTINKLIVHDEISNYIPKRAYTNMTINKILSSSDLIIINGEFRSKKYDTHDDPIFGPDHDPEHIYAEHIIIDAFRKYKIRRKLEIMRGVKKHLIKDLAAIVLQYLYT